jgi:hypothetical protein
VHRTRYLVPAVLAALLCLAAFVWFWIARPKGNGPSPSSSNTAPASASPADPATVAKGSPTAATNVSAHNLMLRKGSDFRIYIRWIRGQMLRARADVNPSLDDAESFVLLIQKGVIRANLGDIGNYLNTDVSAKFPLKKINITGDGDQLKLAGVLHKFGLPLPIELLSTISATPDGRIHLRITKINVLKIPVKALLGGFHVTIDDVMGSAPVPGVEVFGNDLFFDTIKLLPPPHIRGLLTSVRLANPDLVLIYGNAPSDETTLAQWHNFLKLDGGTLDFGKLTMRSVDLTLIDASNDFWFDLDLVNYQDQLVNGYSRMTAQAGLEIFMPDLDRQTRKAAAQSISIEWLKNRNASLPPGVPAK